MRSKRIFAMGAVVATLGLVGTACAAPESDDEGSGDQKTSITLGWNQPFYSYNEQHLERQQRHQQQHQVPHEPASSGTSTPMARLKADTSFGTYEKISDDPLTIKYTVADDAKWSDGTPVDAADVLLDWAARSSNLNTIPADKVKTDEATGLPKNTKGKVYFDTLLVRPRPDQGHPGDR